MVKMQTVQKFQVGDIVVLKPYEEVCANRGLSVNHEGFRKHYDYVNSKGPLPIYHVWKPGEMKYSMEGEGPMDKRGKPTDKYYYNIHTPRSKMYLFDDGDIELYVPPK